MPQVQFYKTLAGNEVVLNFIRQQPANDRRVIGEDLKVLELRYPVGMPLCKSLGDGLWELRSSLPSKREARLLYFYKSKSQTIMIVHGFIKTARTTPKGDLNLASNRKKEVE